MTIDLHRAVAIHNEVKQRIADLYSLSGDDPALLDTVAGETDLEDALIATVREAREAEAMAKAMSTIIADNQARKARYAERAKRLRGIVAWAMAETGQKKLAAPDLTISHRTVKPALVIDDEVLIPDVLKVPVTTFKPDKDAIRMMLENGSQVPGAHLSNGRDDITVRGK